MAARASFSPEMGARSSRPRKPSPACVECFRQLLHLRPHEVPVSLQICLSGLVIVDQLGFPGPVIFDEPAFAGLEALDLFTCCMKLCLQAVQMLNALIDAAMTVSKGNQLTYPTLELLREQSRREKGRGGGERAH